jgi:hypothetical protein
MQFQDHTCVVTVRAYCVADHETSRGPAKVIVGASKPSFSRRTIPPSGEPQAATHRMWRRVRAVGKLRLPHIRTLGAAAWLALDHVQYRIAIHPVPSLFFGIAINRIPPLLEGQDEWTDAVANEKALIEAFGISGYRSFFDPQYFQPLGWVTLMAGQNNAGKSNVSTIR